MIDELLFDVRNGEKRYGGHAALRIEKLQIKKGDRLLVSGENGSGKSTLLRIVAGITELDRGTSHRSANWHDLSVGYLPQEGGVYRDLTIEENRNMYRRVLGAPSDLTRTATIAERLGISSILNKTVGDLSGGFRRLAALYGLLCTRANVLVLDEPFASLDAGKQVAVRSVLRSAAFDDLTLILSEHMEDLPQSSEQSLWTKVLWLKRST